MSGRRTDVLSEAVDGLPLPARWLLRVSLATLKAARVFVVFQGVGGLAAIVVGAVTVNGTLVGVGIAQAALAGSVFALSAMGSEHVTEVTGPDGAFVVRTGARPRWRRERGLRRRLTMLVAGGRLWVVNVRRRDDDPFGPPVATSTADTQRAALAHAEQLRAGLRRGEDVTGPTPTQ